MEPSSLPITITSDQEFYKHEETIQQKINSVLHNPKFQYRHVRKYHGPVKAVIFDWAGTVIDCGVFAPMKTFKKLFENEGVMITDQEARGPMGLHKRVHISKILQYDNVKNLWNEKYNRYPTEDDIDRMYKNFIPIQKISMADHSKLIDGVVPTVRQLQNHFGLKIGSTTGYPSPILKILAELAAKQGYTPDCMVAGDEVPQARPCPHMVWLNALRMDVYPIEAIIKVDDTVDGVREGLSAGCWTVGVTKTGNYMAANEEDLQSMPVKEYEQRLQNSYDILAESGAHYLIDSVSELPIIIDDINKRLSKGERP